MKQFTGWRAILTALKVAVRQGWKTYKFRRTQQRAFLRHYRYVTDKETTDA